MDRPTALIWSWLDVLNAKRAQALRQVYGTLDAALQHIDEHLLRELGCREETVLKALNRLEEFDPDTYEAELAKRGVQFLSIEDEQYPAQLKTIPDAPVFLYFKGNLAVLREPCLALVGTREMSPEGARIVEAFVPPVVRAGMVTVSGLALGIDTAVAEETLAAGGKTVAVLGHGLSRIFPQENARLAQRIVSGGGLILSEFPLDGKTGKFTFPARNRIIAGLSLGTVVLEAGEGSGALITADLALDYGREVFAVPGSIFDPHFAGCHSILSKGTAKLVMAPEQVLSEIGIVASAAGRSAYDPKTPEESALWQALTTLPQTVDDLAERSQMPPASVGSTLTMLELAGAAKHVGDGTWVRR
ncbi:MAG: DNA-processing protein DprA [Candidatus Peribacteraceae bacterium]|nr:DNA-processing protein DprA [Candidatus Peribacteraceae bacterium]